MSVVAVTRISHGKSDGSVQSFNIGDSISGLSEDEVKSLVLSGAAVETGRKRKYSAVPVAGEQDEETLKRDALIAKAASEAVDDDEAVTNISDPAAQAHAAGRGAPAAPGGPAAQSPQGSPEQRARAQSATKDK